ncbi:MAG: hypothetical protein K2L49_06025, partial [Muribaculaceae bacterium]|nr:hypothetical protein [Muribaculaceae bacterium]
MKSKCMIFLLAVLTLCSCGQSKEERAQKVIAEYMKGELYNFDSYEPIQIKVDSSFVTLSTDREIIGLTVAMIKMAEAATEYSNKVERADRSMDLFTPNGRCSSKLIQGEYDRAKDERDLNQKRLEKAREQIIYQFNEIKERQTAVNVGDFNGWQVYHKFKCLNGIGTRNMFGEMIFLCDEDFNVEMAYDKDEFEVLSKIIATISESNDAQG